MSRATRSAARGARARDPAESAEHVTPLPTGGALRSRRKVETLPGGLVWIEEEMELEGRLEGCVVSGGGWLFELHRLSAGEVYYVQDGERVRVEARCFGLLYAPHSITEIVLEDVRSRWVGVAAEGRVPHGRESRPVLVEVDGRSRTSNLIEVLEALTASRASRPIERCTRPSPLSLKTKRALDESYRDPGSTIAEVAARLKVSHAHLTRQFKRDYGMPPLLYRDQLRASDAMLRLSRGEKIIEVSSDVGYNDLGRFYKQFRKLTHSSPGSCRLT
ncbi:MAG: AraC family transcriptional regulator [Acidobacteria bacterium]|nr:AraC family transcriptional regulator [Acidobacteriota bacterium]MCA1641758.1 AraC family transcriptional regulator [Acidobacteriota bacterium]